MSERPIIGIAANVMHHIVDILPGTKLAYTPTDFVDGVRQAGGVPVVLPVSAETDAAQYVGMIDGLVLAGGQDVDPLLFQEEPILQVGASFPERDLFEIALVREVLRQKKPIFAICRGIQLLNVAEGGSLYQDLQSQLPSTLKHLQETIAHYPAHSIRTVAGSLISELIGMQATVNTLHHQAIKTLAPSLRATAFSSDEVIEAVESTDPEQYILGVQWHPEIMLRQAHAQSQKLFQHFVAACR